MFCTYFSFCFESSSVFTERLPHVFYREVCRRENPKCFRDTELHPEMLAG